MNQLPNTFDAAHRAQTAQDQSIRAKRFTGSSPQGVAPQGPRFGADGKVQSAEQAQEVASQFEGLFVQMMVAGMRSTSEMTGEGDGLFGSGPGSDQFTQWFDQNMSASVSQGMDLGVSDAVLQDLKRWGKIRDDNLAVEAEQEPLDPGFQQLRALRHLDGALRQSAAMTNGGGFHATV